MSRGTQEQDEARLEGARGGHDDAGEGAQVILVDEDDRDVGRCGKLAAHERALLHRAVSVFAFDPTGALLIQRRAAGKYHSGGLWSNTACTHPRPDEGNEAAARRCVQEEMGVSCAWIVPAFSFTYRAQVSPSLVEHELDHVYVAGVTEPPAPNDLEVEAWRAVRIAEAEAECAADPSRFSAWFPLALARLRDLEITARASTPWDGGMGDA